MSTPVTRDPLAGKVLACVTDPPSSARAKEMRTAACRTRGKVTSCRSTCPPVPCSRDWQVCPPRYGRGMTTVRTRYADADGVDVAYQVLGDGPVDLLLFTGLNIPID